MTLFIHDPHDHHDLAITTLFIKSYDPYDINDSNDSTIFVTSQHTQHPFNTYLKK